MPKLQSDKKKDPIVSDIFKMLDGAIEVLNVEGTMNVYDKEKLGLSIKSDFMEKFVIYIQDRDHRIFDHAYQQGFRNALSRAYKATDSEYTQLARSGNPGPVLAALVRIRDKILNLK